TYNDYVLPGKIDALTQQRWRVKYNYQSGGRVNNELAVNYPWRLMSYLDWNFQTLYGYYPDYESFYPPTDLEVNQVTPAAQRIANHPAFGYNAYYVGGVWESDLNQTRLVFSNGEWEMDGGDGTTSVTVRGKLVARTIGGINQPSNFLLFCDSIYRNPGIYGNTSEFAAGAPWVVPHILAETEIWGAYTGLVGEVSTDAGKLFERRPVASIFGTPRGARLFGAGAGPVKMEVFVDQAVPYRRFGDSIAVLHADGNTAPVSMPALLDQRKWMNAALDGMLNPQEFSHTP
ncbi:MAG: hypothetical protein MK085_12430, partial [Phycisphaerales bacterium]|nr:hypothetical protein [Phycisphaerales bacterium]